MTRISTSRNDTLALHRMLPTRSPVVSLGQIGSVRPHRPPLHIQQRCAFRLIAVLSPGFTHATVIFDINATAQIAITQRLC